MFTILLPPLSLPPSQSLPPPPSQSVPPSHSLTQQRAKPGTSSPADIRQADMRQADIRQVDMRQADIMKADMRQTNIRKADMRQTNIRKAGTRQADSLTDKKGPCLGLPYTYAIHSTWQQSQNRYKRHLGFHLCQCCWSVIHRRNVWGTTYVCACVRLHVCVGACLHVCPCVDRCISKCLDNHTNIL